jgi:hypothetical protein
MKPPVQWGWQCPGPDGVSTEVLKVVARNCPPILLNMFNRCLRWGVFCRRWKFQRLTMISKGKGIPGTPSAYRPLFMLDTAGKLLERLLKPRLAAAIADAGGLSGRQHGSCRRGGIGRQAEAGRIEWFRNWWVGRARVWWRLFRAYLHKMGKVNSAASQYGDFPTDDTHHTFFVCERWAVQRRALETEVEPISPETLVPLKLTSLEN